MRNYNLYRFANGDCSHDYDDKVSSFNYEELRNLVSVELGTQMTKIPPYAFFGATNLKKITIDSDITEIGDMAFCNCESLEEIVLPKSLARLGTGCFSNCQKLKSIDIEQSFVGIIPLIAFAKCYSLESVKLPDDVVLIDQKAFEQCTSLKEIKLPKNLRRVNLSAFENSGLTHIEFPKHFAELGASSFSGCTSLKSVRLNSVISTIPLNCFRHCKSLEKINLGKVQLIDDNAFEECKLKTIDLTECRKIGSFAFFFNDIEEIEFGFHLILVYRAAFKRNPLKLVINHSYNLYLDKEEVFDTYLAWQYKNAWEDYVYVNKKK